MTELEIREFTGLLDVQTGELLPANVDNAARVLQAARAMKAHVNHIVEEATAYLVRVSEHQGTKTLHGGAETVTITGGTSVEYDEADLIDTLLSAGCPQERIDAAVKRTIVYKVDRAVLRQLAAANPDYKAAIELSERMVDKPFRASVKLRRQSDGE